MTFNNSAFMIAGTAIAIAGVGLYIWDTRGAPALSSYTSPSSSTPSTSSSYNDRDSYFGGRRSKKNKKHLKSKTKRR
jgi:hypothetical protein